MSPTQTDKSWINDFILALRLRGVRGEAIGDAVAVVREHVADSGQAAGDAFGDPRTYAEELELPTVRRTGASSVSVMAPVVSLLAIVVLGRAASAVFGGSALGLSLTQLGLVLIPMALMLGLPYYFNFAVRHLWVFAVVFVLATGAAALSGFFDPHHGTPAIVVLNAGWVLAVAAVTIALMSAWQLRRALTDAADPLVDPLQPSPAAERHARIAAMLPAVLMPVMALVVLAIAWVAR
ncbi:MAG: hypothetical protein ACTHWW_05845 [Arthrobacter sp.]|uniref:hypothetical protein n=1 Tax=Arthrobacter sp. 179 TaxID=3457734 RepID=UPI002652AF1E|nr:hypothetical protein [Micrococcaceae bacterium]MDN5812602.1 hypothetical protein [Micrococcaceae bacterium]MDN5823403.1 hypothetical protein [Micrococcaceae bacterium]MDN5878700.1 hypothetical protein [Micrococcaceae bacterium]MDN5886224.1 hypothetical protein [Micrococcaceae bacterium]